MLPWRVWKAIRTGSPHPTASYRNATVAHALRHQRLHARLSRAPEASSLYINTTIISMSSERDPSLIFPNNDNRVMSEGFVVVARMDGRTWSREMAEEFYKEHRDKPFFNDLVRAITSGPLVQLCLEKVRKRERSLRHQRLPSPCTLSLFLFATSFRHGGRPGRSPAVTGIFDSSGRAATIEWYLSR